MMEDILAVVLDEGIAEVEEVDEIVVAAAVLFETEGSGKEMVDLVAGRD
jgi:hypothetical protein